MSIETIASLDPTSNQNSLQEQQLRDDLGQDDAEISKLGALLKACGDPLRLQILQVLKADTFGVLELTQMFDTKQSGMSHHLKVLNKVGLVETQREGNAIFYRRPFQRTKQQEDLLGKVFELIDLHAIGPELEERMSAIRIKRSAQSQAFFERNAEHLSEQQELIAEHEQYAQASFDLLQKLELPRSSKVLEIGPGEGRFLKRLSLSYDKVVALDTSAQMLDLAREFSAQEGLKNIEFFLGDSLEYQKNHNTVDAVVMNMVLHHVPAPIKIFQQCAQIIRSGGGLVICDLTHHDQEWTRAGCGDLWLGFQSDELKHWAKTQGFSNEESIFIGLRNGFQIQLHSFIKN